MNLKQIKLSNDDEIICEVIQAPTPTNPDIIIRRALKLLCVEDHDRNLRYYSFKPYMSFVDNIDALQSLNTNHVITQLTPSTGLALHYATACKEAEKSLENKTTLNLDEVLGEIDLYDLSEDELDTYLRAKLAELKGDNDTTTESSSDDESENKEANVISFKPKGTVH